MNSLAEMKAQKAQMIATMKAKGQEMLMVEFNKFFADNPNVSALAWTQYTPYFSDGDPCTFGIGDMNAFLSDPSKIDARNFKGWGDDEGWITTYVYGAQKTPENIATAAKLKEFADLVQDEELFQMTFGDHVKVIATPGKFQTFEHEHD